MVLVRINRKSKYGNIPKVFLGKVYDSQNEALFARDLELRKKAKDIKDYERQVSFSIGINNEHICYYIADFVVTNNNGSKDVVEIKGFETEVFKIKWRLMKAVWGKKYKLILIHNYKST